MFILVKERDGEMRIQSGFAATRSRSKLPAVGRPAKNEEERVEKRSVSMTDAEFSACQRAAELEERTFSNWARLVLRRAAEEQLRKKEER
jgi:hypothetical protein